MIVLLSDKASKQTKGSLFDSFYNQEMNIKIALSSKSLELKKSKTGCGVSALQFFVK
jgi:hypothetical protein